MAPGSSSLLAAPAAASPTARRMLTVLVVGLFLSTFVSDSRIGKLPLQFLLKNDLHLTPTAMAAFFGLTNLAWYFKPVAGLLSDAVPLWGTRRRGYLIVSGLGASLLWAMLGLVPREYGPLVATLIGANAFAVLASSVSGGLLVELGQREGWTGRMGALRETIIAGTMLLAQPLGGYLATQKFGWTCGLGAFLFLGLLPAALFLREKRAPSGPLGPEIRTRLTPVFRSRTLWLAALFIFLKELTPGLGTPLYYVQTDTLKFDSPFIGWLGGLSNASAIVGAFVYAALCRRMPLGRILILGTLLNALGTLLFLGYASRASAIGIHLLIGPANSGILGIFISVAIMDLAARATPVGGEAMAYSLLMSVANLAGTASDILGSYLYGTLHFSLTALVWVSSLTTLVTLFALPLIPRSFLSRTEFSSRTE